MADGGEAVGGGGAGLVAELLGAGAEVPAADAGVADGGGGDHHLHQIFRVLQSCGTSFDGELAGCLCLAGRLGDRGFW